MQIFNINVSINGVLTHKLMNQSKLCATSAYSILSHIVNAAVGDLKGSVFLRHQRTV